MSCSVVAQSPKTASIDTRSRLRRLVCHRSLLEKRSLIPLCTTHSSSEDAVLYRSTATHGHPKMISSLRIDLESERIYSPTMRILILTQFFDPEPASIPGLPLATWLAKRGHDVQVVTGFPNYPGCKFYPEFPVRIRSREAVDRVRI